MRTVSFFLLGLTACSSPDRAPAAAPAPPPAAAALASATELRYSVLTADRVVGGEVVRRAADGTVTSQYHFNDRGRGPELTTRLWACRDGLPWRMEVRGVDYYKVPVQEDFAREGDRVRWKNSSEDGSATVAGPAFYLPLDGGPEAETALARALLASRDRKVALLPSGEARIAELGRTEVTRGAERKTIILFAISGVSFDPSIVWLEADGTLFANLGEWGGTTREGWEKSAPAVREHQRRLARARLQEMAKRLTHRPSGPIAFQNVGVFDARARRI